MLRGPYLEGPENADRTREECRPRSGARDRNVEPISSFPDRQQSGSQRDRYSVPGSDWTIWGNTHHSGRIDESHGIYHGGDHRNFGPSGKGWLRRASQSRERPSQSVGAALARRRPEASGVLQESGAGDGEASVQLRYTRARVDRKVSGREFEDLEGRDKKTFSIRVALDLPSRLIRTIGRGVLTSGLLLSLQLSAHAATCRTTLLLHQRRDCATIARLEKAWTLAYLSGDSDLEKCILTSDFTEILRTGEVKVLKDELRFAEENRGKNLNIPDSPRGTILLHGNVAVAYGSSISKTADGTLPKLRYADYYVWDGRQWHAFFAQQTQISNSTP
jgi:hypothetical protein